MAGHSCRGICGSADHPRMKKARVMMVSTGRTRPPADPATGRLPPAGSYGGWVRCPACCRYLYAPSGEADYAVPYPLERCPCCNGRVSSRPRAAVARRSRTVRDRRKKERGQGQ